MFRSLKKVHIIGIGGCAASAIAEYLIKQQILVTGSEQKHRSDLTYLEKMGITVFYQHDQNQVSVNGQPDLVLYSPAIMALSPNNPEILAAKALNIPLMSWQAFIGDYFNALGSRGITVTGSEGKGTTAGILTMILKGTHLDPLAILGARLKNVQKDLHSNIYAGNGKTYILEGDEFNRNFHNYHPSINVMINFSYEHPETYPDFGAYQQAFYEFFKGMQKSSLLILRAQTNTIDFVEKYQLAQSHRIIWFGKQKDMNQFDLREGCIIVNHHLDEKGNTFELHYQGKKYHFFIPALPGYLVYNATGAILAALEAGLPIDQIQLNIQRFSGMVRRFDLFKTSGKGIFITDYGHSPHSISHIIKEIKTIFPSQKLHLIFQPHLFSRTFNFFNEFVASLSTADRTSIVDIYPAREDPQQWENKIHSKQLTQALHRKGCKSYYVGPVYDIQNALAGKISEDEITCFIGAGDMDQYFNEIFQQFQAKPYFK
ncbi:MAG: Mur ligase domain-containing protein [Spirochaetes bacterium]|nr:Mur ligase domain-containing protein [Spirochaetota bacterium]